MLYRNAIEVRVGDRVRHDEADAVVEDVIDGDDVARWGLDAPGFLLLCERCGRVLVIPGSLDWEDVTFAGRADGSSGLPAPPSEVLYALEPGLEVAEMAVLLERSGLAERRPMDEPDTLKGMIAGADVLITARVGGVLVGLSRAISDFCYCTYLSDLAVDEAHQHRGIGRELVRLTHEAAGLGTMLVLLAAPKAREYYPRIGMTAHDSCWIIPRTPARDSGA